MDQALCLRLLPPICCVKILFTCKCLSVCLCISSSRCLGVSAVTGGQTFDQAVVSLIPGVMKALR